MTYYCGVCQAQFVDYTETVEHWIACDDCDNWFHYSCVGLMHLSILTPTSPLPGQGGARVGFCCDFDCIHVSGVGHLTHACFLYAHVQNVLVCNI